MQFEIREGILTAVSPADSPVVCVPEGVTEIGAAAFAGCPFERIVLPPGVRVIQQHAFLNCTALTQITLPDSLRSIGRFAFAGCENLLRLDIPPQVQEIGNSAFRSCAAMTDITLPERVQTLGHGLFSECFSLRAVRIPAGIVTLGKRMFSSCYALRSVTLPPGIRRIDERAFEDCRSLAALTLPEGVQEIGFCAFAHCRSLRELQIPASVCRVETPALQDTAFFTEQPGDFVVIGGGVLAEIRSQESTVRLPAGVRVIAPEVCKNRAVSEIILPDTVERIDERAFAGLPALQRIHFPDGLNSIGECAFADCEQLLHTALPGSLCRIGKDAFAGTRFFPPEDGGALVENGILLRCSCTEEVCRLPEGLRVIADSAFTIGSAFRTVVIPAGVTHIGKNAFQWAEGLCRITVPAGVQEIGAGAFGYCDAPEIDIAFAGEKICGENALPARARVTFRTKAGDFTVTLQKDLCNYVRQEEQYLAEFAAHPDAEHLRRLTVPEYIHSASSVL